MITSQRPLECCVCVVSWNLNYTNRFNRYLQGDLSEIKSDKRFYAFFSDYWKVSIKPLVGMAVSELLQRAPGEGMWTFLSKIVAKLTSYDAQADGFSLFSYIKSQTITNKKDIWTVAISSLIKFPNKDKMSIMDQIEL